MLKYKYIHQYILIVIYTPYFKNSRLLYLVRLHCNTNFVRMSTFDLLWNVCLSWMLDIFAYTAGEPGYCGHSWSRCAVCWNQIPWIIGMQYFILLYRNFAISFYSSIYKKYQLYILNIYRYLNFLLLLQVLWAFQGNFMSNVGDYLSEISWRSFHFEYLFDTAFYAFDLKFIEILLFEYSFYITIYTFVLKLIEVLLLKIIVIYACKVESWININLFFSLFSLYYYYYLCFRHSTNGHQKLLQVSQIGLLNLTLLYLRLKFVPLHWISCFKSWIGIFVAIPVTQK